MTMIRKFNISGNIQHLQIAGAANQLVRVGAEGFFKQLLELPPARYLDLLTIAAAVYSVDRISKRSWEGGNEHGYRRFHLTLELREPRFWRTQKIVRPLSETLAFLSNDDWQFDFVPRPEAISGGGNQEFLALPKDVNPELAALYSGGLDSAAGLANRAIQGENNFALLTVGHQTSMHKLVTQQIQSLVGILKHERGINLKISHSTLTISLRGDAARRMRLQEKTQRVRAFLFCVAAAIVAKAYRLDRVDVFENGVGAINLPLMTGMLGTGLATRGAHPTFLNMMSEFCSKIGESPVQFVLPFMNKTKAEMLSPLTSTPKLHEWLQKSRSCIHTAHRIKGIHHCGVCPGCIERRQAFLASGARENLDEYELNILDHPKINERYADYFRLFQQDALDWVGRSPRPRVRLTKHLRITNTPQKLHLPARELQIRSSFEAIRVFGSPIHIATRMKNGAATAASPHKSGESP